MNYNVECHLHQSLKHYILINPTSLTISREDSPRKSLGRVEVPRLTKLKHSDRMPRESPFLYLLEKLLLT